MGKLKKEWHKEDKTLMLKKNLYCFISKYKVIFFVLAFLIPEKAVVVLLYSAKYVKDYITVSCIDVVLSMAILILAACISFKNRSETKNNKKMEYMAYHDPLTGLPNRALFMENFKNLIDESRRINGLFAVLYMDLDCFKCINDRLGHLTGDSLLQTLSNRLSTCIRRGDIVCRMGGDEFAMLFPNISCNEDALTLAGKILNIFSEPFNANGNELYITTSIGISIYPYDGVNMDELIDKADIAMYYAKDCGKNNYKLYTKNMIKKDIIMKLI